MTTYVQNVSLMLSIYTQMLLQIQTEKRRSKAVSYPVTTNHNVIRSSTQSSNQHKFKIRPTQLVKDDE